MAFFFIHLRFFFVPPSFFFSSSSLRLVEIWNVLRFTERERKKKKVPGYPQRRTKAQCMTRREALLIRGIACLQEQPQEFEDCTTLTIASPPHYPNPVFSLCYPRKEGKKKKNPQLFILSTLNNASFPTFSFTQITLRLLFPVPSIITFSPLSYLDSQACLPSYQFAS